ncbi:monovalent cation/H(+) antiporter subunit G [Capnocytophaga catalasegens]|uniref:Na+/H+ antiporter subunit G n=1 Tax=Capnocytophaga catalasegens TaxID=1004260 RepID=A0AAV5AZM6_9FLAO|nr:monovalent cation/H(+) antiporter subunit G [Capnocytophaga catalasegens]GIZ15403.1 Na+/H+ antiporter subunit G [Capnocytophaga catalasegens]GJM50991.1 Na+/H+ antiporter subunit G [Capnocytophaga catalasegens]GJM52176.1 Na+/H+ antiporter subunit G [Capnocytophaga catalasegens]
MIEILIGVLAFLGALFILMAGIGVVRMPDTYLRMSVATKSTTLGVGLTLVAFGLHFQEQMTTMRVLIIILFVMITAPVSAHLMGRATYISKNKLWDKSVSDDLKDKYDEEDHC